jgi:hypothetical protein
LSGPHRHECISLSPTIKTLIPLHLHIIDNAHFRPGDVAPFMKHANWRRDRARKRAMSPVGFEPTTNRLKAGCSTN